MIKKFGIMKNLGFDQLSYSIVNGLNGYYENPKVYAKMGDFVDFVVFSEIAMPTYATSKSFGIYHFSEIFEYNGPIMATDVSGADYLTGIPTVHKKYFYLWDLDWTRQNPKDWESLARVYQNPQLNLVCRSDDHARAVESAWNVKVNRIISEFNMEEIIKLC